MKKKIIIALLFVTTATKTEIPKNVEDLINLYKEGKGQNPYTMAKNNFDNANQSIANLSTQLTNIPKQIADLQTQLEKIPKQLEEAKAAAKNAEEDMTKFKKFAPYVPEAPYVPGPERSVRTR